MAAVSPAHGPETSRVTRVPAREPPIRAAKEARLYSRRPTAVSRTRMAQLTPTGLIKIFGQVTAIMVFPIVGGAVAGLVMDGMLGTSPLLVLIGLAVGTLISAKIGRAHV